MEELSESRERVEERLGVLCGDLLEEGRDDGVGALGAEHVEELREPREPRPQRHARDARREGGLHGARGRARQRACRVPQQSARR